ncbi:hypothetical protein OUZ56_011416 [Daphnia magna]|uniref:Uncharacterized protein n=1 Tax=Daphnia magna TaxID=35525 RepID=A0ABQ9Z085_9CRUS|nr:hypothetical protein OUZ56_011416 [Daphnia magna]
MNQEAKQKRHEERSHHMEQLAADRRELIELKRREVAFREEKNKMIRQLALNKNNNDPQDVLILHSHSVWNSLLRIVKVHRKREYLNLEGPSDGLLFLTYNHDNRDLFSLIYI